MKIGVSIIDQGTTNTSNNVKAMMRASEQRVIYAEFLAARVNKLMHLNNTPVRLAFCIDSTRPKKSFHQLLCSRKFKSEKSTATGCRIKPTSSTV